MKLPVLRGKIPYGGNFVFRQSENFVDGAGILKEIGLMIFKFPVLKKMREPGKILKTFPEFFPAEKFS